MGLLSGECCVALLETTHMKKTSRGRAWPTHVSKHASRVVCLARAWLISGVPQPQALDWFLIFYGSSCAKTIQERVSCFVGTPTPVQSPPSANPGPTTQRWDPTYLLKVEEIRNRHLRAIKKRLPTPLHSLKEGGGGQVQPCKGKSTIM